MSKRTLIPVTRFKNSDYYSDQLLEAIKEFQEDISRVYIAGYSYSEVISNTKIKDVHKSLSDKFPGKNDKSKFPFLNKFVNYVFTRDEIYNPFGKWLRFEYLHPLMLLEYAAEITRTSARRRISLSSIASTIFVLLQYYGVTSFEELKKERGRLLTRRYKYDEWNDNDKKVWDILRKGKIFSNRPIISYKPNYFYDLAGVSDYRTFEANCKLLNVETGYIKKNKSGYISVLVVGEIKQLKYRFEDFVWRNKERYNELNNKVPDKSDSGISLSTLLQNKINTLYDTVLIRDKKIPSLKYLNLNPLIRLTNYNNKDYCHLQSDFYDFNFVIASLYLNDNENRRTLKKPLSEFIGEQIKSAIVESARKLDPRRFNKIIDENHISDQLKYISSPRNRGLNAHFRQIEECNEIVKQISQNGIVFDTVVAKLLLQTELSTLHEPDNENEQPDFSSDVELDDDAYPQELKRLTSKKKIKEIEKLINSVYIKKVGRKYQERIHGIFTPHGASTHRMTSHKFNLQGINKKLKRKLLIAPKGKCLLSADVAGQDITVAANLAKKLYQNPEVFKTDVKQEFNTLLEQIKETILLLGDSSSRTSTPIDYILDNVISAASQQDIDWYGLQVRDEIKRAVYTFFYGGGRDSFLNTELPLKVINESILDLVDACKTQEKAFRADHRIKKGRCLTYGWSKRKEISAMINAVELFLSEFHGKYFSLLTEEADIYETEEELQELSAKLETIKKSWGRRTACSFIYDTMQVVLKGNYPGILESFEYYYEYYKQRNLSYPTFLGWETVVSLEYEHGKMLTKSKSFPVQASGAEFIRQWLIELKRDIPTRLQGDDVLKIVNVIHDQVVIEVKKSVKKEAKGYLIEKAKRAAAAIGIDPRTLHIPEVEELYPIPKKKKTVSRSRRSTKLKRR